MKLCYVVHQFLPRFFTGTEQYVFSLAKEMARRGHDVHVFALEPAFGEETRPFVEEDVEIDGLAVTRVHFWTRMHRDFLRLEYQHPYMGLRFGRLLDRIAPDAVHFFHLRYLGANLIDEAGRRGLPALVHLMDFWFLCPAVILTRHDGSLCDGPPDGGLGCLPCIDPWLERESARLGIREWEASLQRIVGRPASPGGSVPARLASVLARQGYLARQLLSADRILSPSRFLRDVFARAGIPAARIDVVPYGVDRQRLAAARGGGTRRRDGPTTFGFMGSLSPHKGTHLLVDAFLRTRGEARLSIWGRDSDFADYARPLRERAGRDPRIAFHGPFAPQDLGRVLAGVDVLVAPSRWYENTPFVVLEAFAADVPVVATDLGGLREIVHHGRDGELFGRDDVGDLARRLQRLIDEPDRLARYRAAIEPPPGLEQNADRLLEHYRALTGAAASRDAAGAEKIP